MRKYQTPAPAATLLVTLRPSHGAALLVIGSNRLAAARIFTALEGSYKVYVTYSPNAQPDEEVLHRIQTGEASYLELNEATLLQDITAIPNLDIVCVTDSLLTSVSNHRRSFESCQNIAKHCKARRVHVNVVDWTTLNDFSFPATHRWRTGDTAHSLQIAVNTFGKGCRLATRIKREIISSLQAEIGKAVDNIALIRSKIIDLPDDDDQPSNEPLNTPVPQYASPQTHYFENAEETRQRRMKWVAQVSEYWPIKTIGRLRESDIDRILTDFDGTTTPAVPTANTTPVISRSPSVSNLHTQTLHALNIHPPESKPRILLLGSGPGHPALLTIAAHKALLSADLVLADKLVPSAILALIPTKNLIIAKKFPGNAENAQIELQQLALEFLESRTKLGQGGTVVRLKQGDPFIYGRGGEEVLFFRAHGYSTILVPGISSAISAPLLCSIPVTQRGVSDSVLLCTGVGRAGKTSIMPGFKKTTTLVVLMGVARIDELVRALISDDAVVGTTREGPRYPPYLPIAVIERASSPDQRCLLSTLDNISNAITRLDDQRPPGMLVIGLACLALVDGYADDEESIRAQMGSTGYKVTEGMDTEWMGFLNEVRTY